MSILKASEVAKMEQQDKETKLQELSLEHVKSHVAAKKATAKTKEIKKAIARLKTSLNMKRISDILANQMHPQQSAQPSEKKTNKKIIKKKEQSHGN